MDGGKEKEMLIFAVLDKLYYREVKVKVSFFFLAGECRGFSFSLAYTKKKKGVGV